jgi:murein DD-endopeptidase MepM/ murein hydrolase activator NlpD
MTGKRVWLPLVALVVAAATGVRVDRASGPQHSGVDRAGEAAVSAGSGGPAGSSADAAASAPYRTRTVEVRRGDSLVRALTREGVDPKASTDIAAALARWGVNLKRVKPRDTVEITWNLDGDAVAVRYEPSPWLGFAVMATDRGGWEVRRAETRPDVRVEAVSGRVRRSLFEAVEQVGESAPLVVGLVEIFSSDFDFTADTRPGDRFRVLVEKRYAGEQFVDYGRILAAQYLTDTATLTGVSFESASAARPGYFDLSGRSLRKSFLKSPLEFTRITSGFTYARPHPILGGVRPHLAIDYAAPVGTPVRAVADGRVVAAGWDGGNGISVRIRHRAGYETMYNHLSRLGPGIWTGTGVMQRQVIGYVGATGLATGPHLDYRVSLRGQFVNPLSEKFIPGEPIAPAERETFLEQAHTLVRRLEAEAPI